jgi:hypothetical protein
MEYFYMSAPNSSLFFNVILPAFCLSTVISLWLISLMVETRKHLLNKARKEHSELMDDANDKAKFKECGIKYKYTDDNQKGPI